MRVKILELNVTVSDFSKEVGRQLLQLVKEHKEHCNTPDCGIQVCFFHCLFEELMGREATNEESKSFI